MGRFTDLRLQGGMTYGISGFGLLKRPLPQEVADCAR